MSTDIIVALINLAATIGAAVVAAWLGQKFGKRKGREEKEQEIDDAPRKYVEYIGQLIKTAVSEGKENAFLNARAIVSTRNDLRDSMLSISELLNSDIDRLERETRETGSNKTKYRKKPIKFKDSNNIYETIQVLAKKWPAKNDQIEVNLRKILAELGMFGKSPNQTRRKMGK